MIRPAALVLCLALATGCGTAAAGHRAGQAQSSTPTPTPATPTTTRLPTRVRATTLPWHLPTASSRQALVTLGAQRVLLAGGMLADDSSAGEVRAIDLTSGRSRPAAPLAVPVHDAAGGRYAGRAAVYGGGNTAEQSLVQALKGPRWRRVDAFPTSRSDLSVVTMADRTVALGGYDGSAVPRATYVQQGSGHMRPLGHLVHGVRYAATAAVGKDVYVFGGEVDHAELDTVQRLDARTGHTVVVAHLPHALGHAMAATIGGRVLLMGGHTDPAARTRAIWWFDPATRRFTRAGHLPRPLSDAAVAVVGSTVWLLGGEDPSVTDRVVRVLVR